MERRLLGGTGALRMEFRGTMNPITLVLIAGIQRQRVKLQKSAKRYGRLAANALKRWDFERAISHGAKAAAAVAADAILKEQQDKIRRSDP